MTHDEIKESLSAYFDGQLGPEKAVEITAHLQSCKDCRAALDELGALSAGVRDNLKVKAPDAMKARVLERAQEKRPLFPTVVVVAFAAIILVLMAGVAAKKYMPALFSNIQGMINGAASTLGSSSGNK